MTSNNFKTIKKNDPEFEDYLWGSRFLTSSNLIVLPIKTLNLGEVNETVTFQIFSKFEIIKPNFILFLSSLIKIHTYVLIVMPLFFVLVKNYVDDRFRDPFSVSLSIFAMCFLYAGLNIRNDVIDHVYGYDRVNILKSNKPIALGWITAKKSSIISWILIFISALVSLPIFILQPELKWVFIVLFLLALVGKFLNRNEYKHNRLGEVILFLLSGIGLVCGYQVSLGAGIDTEVLAFGVLWGFAILFLIHTNNFSHILTSSQAGIKNTMTQLGFDKAQIFLVSWWIVFCVLWGLFHFFYASTIWTIFGTLLLIFWSIPMLKKIVNLKSPLSSDLDLIRKDAYNMFLIMVLILFIENFWYLGEKLNWKI